MENKGYCLLENVDLFGYNSMRVHAVAKELYLPYTVTGMAELCNSFSDSREFIIIGKASNTIFSKESYDIPVVCTRLLDRIEMKDNSICVQCGASLSDIAWFAQENAICGYEFLEDIPGSAGGAVFMNAGTHDGTVSSLVESVTVYDFEKKETREISAYELEPFWGKRKSAFQKFDCCILECRLKADKKGDRTEILEKMLSTKKSRYLKQPREFPSAGSVFKRPCVDGKDYYVWKLLEEAGLRGYCVGDACVSGKHPGFIVNKGSCTGEELVVLLNQCKAKVKEMFGIELEEEWRIV